MDHSYIEKIKNQKNITKDEKLDYIKNLSFDSNKIILKSNNFNMTEFTKDFNDIILDTNKLYVYLDLQSVDNTRTLSEIDYKDIYSKSLKNIENLFGSEYIILHSSKLLNINEKKNAAKTFLIYCDKSVVDYSKNQKEVIGTIALMSNLPKWEFRELMSLIHQMQLYKVLYKDMFTHIPENRVSNFLETTTKDKIYGMGVIKKTVKSKKDNNEKYTIYSFKVEPEFKNYKEAITFKFNIVTKVFVMKNSSNVLSIIKSYNNKNVQITVLGDVSSIRNLYDKKSITFNIHKFDDCKYHLYCVGIDILRKNNFTSIVKGSVERYFPILENESFYKNNIKKKLIIGIVFEKNLKDKIQEYIFYFNNMLDNKSKWTTSHDVEIKHIAIDVGLEQSELISTLKSSHCDCYICITDNIYYEEPDDSDAVFVNDYYKLIKDYNLNQNLENKEVLITQGLIVPPLQEEEQDVLNEEEDLFKDKIKTVFYELCTKYVFYSNTIKLASCFDENEYLVVSFNCENKVFSNIRIRTQGNEIIIVSKQLLRINAINGTGLRKDENLINSLRKDIENPEEILKKVNSYEDFIIYDLKEKNFLLCSSNQTYLLSDNEYWYRKELINKYRKEKKYTKVNKVGDIIEKESTNIMSLLMPLYNISKTMNGQIFLFEINNEQYYFVGNEMKKTQEHPQSPLVKMYFNENNQKLLDLYFAVITTNVVRNGLNTKTTLFEKFSKLHMIN